MGVDLALLPVTCNEGTLFFSHTRLDVIRSGQLFQSIRDGGMKGETCYGDVRDDAYGEVLTFVRAGELAAVLAAHPSVELAPVVAYVAAMPAYDLIALYWH